MVLILWKRFQCVSESEAWVKTQQSSQFWRHDAPTMTIKWHLQYTSSNSIVLRSCKVLVEILHSDASRSHQRKPSYIRNPETFPFESFTVSWCWNYGNINYPHCHTENTNCYWEEAALARTNIHTCIHTPFTFHSLYLPALSTIGKADAHAGPLAHGHSSTSHFPLAQSHTRSFHLHTHLVFCPCVFIQLFVCLSGSTWTFSR